MRTALCAALTGVMSLAGCADWLDVSSPPDEAVLLDDPISLDLAGLPNQPASVNAKGPILPGSPGLRVPRGYMTHARLDSADFLLAHTWMALDSTSSAGVQAASRTTLRLVATGSVSGAIPSPVPSVRGVFPLAVPKGTSAEDLVGFTARGPSLANARVGIRTGGDHHWMVTPTRLSIDQVTPRAIKGSFEGTARRGAKSERTRRFHAGFVALRAPAR